MVQHCISYMGCPKSLDSRVFLSGSFDFRFWLMCVGSLTSHVHSNCVHVYTRCKHWYMYSRKSLKDHQEESLFLMSEITRNQSLAIRGQAVEMVLAGSTTREAAEALGVSQSAVSKWMKKSQQGQSLSNKPRFGRPKVLDRISKNVIKKSLIKKTPIYKETCNQTYSCWSSSL